MSIKVALHHHTSYRYDRPISVGPQVIRLRPAPHCRTPIESYSLRVEPADHFLNWQQDPHGNFLARIVFEEKIERLSIDVNLVANLSTINPFDFFVEDSVTQFPFQYNEEELEDLKPYLVTSNPGPKLTEFLGSIHTQFERTIDFLVDVNQRLQSEIDYLVRLEPGVQTCEQTLTKRSGSCRDSAWLLVQILRNLGIAARFTSGYLIQLKPDVKSLDGP
ncbi:MAG: transglutaminase family protein, partial [Planctomycetota bacterium]